MFNRLIFINDARFIGVLKFETELNNDDLDLSIELWKLTGNITKSIIDSFENRPMSSFQVFKTIDKELVIREILSFIQINKLYLDIIETKTLNLEKIKISNLNSIKLEIIKNFLKEICENYDLIKSKIVINTQGFEEKIISNNTNKEVNTYYQPQQSTPFIQSAINSEIETEIEMILKDIYKLCPNNIVKYFLTKNILTEIETGLYYKNVNDFFIQDSGIQIKIPMITISNGFIKDIFLILDSFDYDKDTCLSKMFLLYKQLVYIITNDIEQKSSQLFLSFKIIELLFFIYVMKYSNKNILIVTESIINKYIHYLVNEGIKFIQSKYSNGFNTPIQFITDNPNHIINKYDEELISIIDKYKYLIDIDRSSFIEHVFNNYNNSTTNKQPFFLPITSPTILDINKILTNSLTTQSYISYKLLELPKEYSQHKVISKPYYDLLKLMYTPVDTVNCSYISVKDIDEVVLKYANSLITNLMPNITKLIDKSQPISILYILDYMIRPYIDISNNSFDTTAKLIYQIVIPYIHDIYGINQFIDYFH